MKPLEGLLVLDFSQFLAGPYAALRLADLGAEVIKIENPDRGDICRHTYISNVDIDGDSSLFQAINRNKSSIAADLKCPDQKQRLHRLIARADVVIFNFRPGVAQRLGLDYEAVRTLNPGLVYGDITGYGKEGPWRGRPGQDLLVQATSGMAWLNGNADQPPLPVGLSIVDMMAGEHLTQGLLAALIRRGISGEGAYVEANMLESALDIQFEGFTAFLNDGHALPVRSAVNNANPYIGAPYGIYRTADGYLALAMAPVPALGQLLECPALETYTDPADWSGRRDEIKSILVEHLQTKQTAAWLAVLEANDIWCADVLDWTRLMEHEGFRALDMVQTVTRDSGVALETLRCPIRIDGQRYRSAKAAPKLNEHDPARIAALLGGA